MLLQFLRTGLPALFLFPRFLVFRKILVYDFRVCKIAAQGAQILDDDSFTDLTAQFCFSHQWLIVFPRGKRSLIEHRNISQPQLLRKGFYLILRQVAVLFHIEHIKAVQRFIAVFRIGYSMPYQPLSEHSQIVTQNRMYSLFVQFLYPFVKTAKMQFRRQDLIAAETNHAVCFPIILKAGIGTVDFLLNDDLISRLKHVTDFWVQVLNLHVFFM